MPRKKGGDAARGTPLLTRKVMRKRIIRPASTGRALPHSPLTRFDQSGGAPRAIYY
ncbi:MAG: hypothetical protein AB7J35_16940 [Dehalococcoidia bacterium]